MTVEQLMLHIEALVFASDRPLTQIEITDVLQRQFETALLHIEADKIATCIEAIKEKYEAEHYAFQFVDCGGGYQFLTKKAYHETIAQLNGDKFLKKLSTAAMETLSIIAYKQPITKADIEHIRGVSSDYSIQKLLEKELIIIIGRDEQLPGKPLIYGTSKYFMDYLGINSPKDLPQLKDIEPAAVEPTDARDAIVVDGGLMVNENGELIEPSEN